MGDRQRRWRNSRKCWAGSGKPIGALLARTDFCGPRIKTQKALAMRARCVRKAGIFAGACVAGKILCGRSNVARAELLRPQRIRLPLDTQFVVSLGERLHECAGQTELAAKSARRVAAASQADRKRAEGRDASKHLVEQANELARQNKFPDALALLNQALEKNPKNGFAYTQKAKSISSMRRPDQARQALSSAGASALPALIFCTSWGVIAAQQGSRTKPWRRLKQ